MDKGGEKGEEMRPYSPKTLPYLASQEGVRWSVVSGGRPRKEKPLRTASPARREKQTVTLLPLRQQEAKKCSSVYLD
jgi:hypothetical protein